MKTRLEKMFRGGLDNYELRCVTCERTYEVTDIAAARAHQNFKAGHRIVVYHNLDGCLGPLSNFTRIRG